MAKIIFYESSAMDTRQLTRELQSSHHYWEFQSETLQQSHIDPDAEVISVFVNSTVTQQLLKRMPKLKLIATRSTGFDHIDTDYARAQGITVVNIPTYGENTVAEHAFSLLLAVSHRLIPTVSLTKKGVYEPTDFTGTDLMGKTMGVIGAGHIGVHTIQIAKGFGMNVVAYDPNENKELAKKYGFEYVPINQLYHQSDVISLHTPLVPGSYHMINEASIARMKPGVILINTARGELVENRALISALTKGRIAGAGLDTLEGERFLHNESIINNLVQNAADPESYLATAETQALLRMPQVVITPHSAYNTKEAISRINKTTASNITSFFHGKPQNIIKDGLNTGKLIIIRHTQSDWNEQGKWTGTTDVHLSKQGVQDAAKIGEIIKNEDIDYTYISQQIRTKETLEGIMNGSQKLDIRYETTAAFNERDYGIYTGMRKNEIEKIIGEEAYTNLRRDWDGPIEGGESLKDVFERTIPFYLRIILPRLRHGQNVLVIAHGNSIRSIVKYIENISDDEISNLEMIQNSVLIYNVDKEGRSKNKKTLTLKTGAKDIHQ